MWEVMMEIGYAAKVATGMYMERVDLYLTLDEDEVNSVFQIENGLPFLYQYIEKAFPKFKADPSFNPVAVEIYSVFGTGDIGCRDKCIRLASGISNIRSIKTYRS